MWGQVEQEEQVNLLFHLIRTRGVLKAWALDVINKGQETGVSNTEADADDDGGRDVEVVIVEVIVDRTQTLLRSVVTKLVRDEES
ncbi:hypothetical protein ACLOJK_004878 [Asimina triloba]